MTTQTRLVRRNEAPELSLPTDTTTPRLCQLLGHRYGDAENTTIPRRHTSTPKSELL